MKAPRKFYHNHHWIYEIQTEHGMVYSPDIDWSEWATLDGAKAHIDYLQK